MDSDEMVSCVGKAEDDPAVQRLLASLSITKKLKMPKSSIHARHDLPRAGLSLVFKPEAPKSSRLLFRTVQFLSDEEQGYKRYPGALPAGLSFSDGQAEARAKLGSPMDSDEDLRLDIWEFQGRELSINYSYSAPHRINAVSVQMKDEA